MTLFTLLMAGFQTLLWRYSGQKQIVVGTDVANRNAPETEDLLGFFINVLPIRTEFTAGATFRQLAGRLQHSLFGAYAHQQLPFARMVQEIQPERSRSHNPLVQVLFVLQNTPRTQPAMAGVEIVPFALPVTSSKFDLAVFVSEQAGVLTTHWIYATELFERATILDMSRRFEKLLSSAVLDPDCSLGSIELSSPGEERRTADHSAQLLSVTPEAVEIEAD